MYVIVAGSGLGGRGIIEVLVQNKHDVVVIDINNEVCEAIYAETGVMAINGNATNKNILMEAGAEKADVLICLMPNDADNLATGLLAKSLQIPRVIGRLKNPQYADAYNLAGITIVRAVDLLLNQVIMEVEQPKVKRIMLIADGKAGIYSVRIPEESKVPGQTVTDVDKNKDFPRECAFMGVYKEDKGKFIIPRGDYEFETGDDVFLISKSQYIKQATDFMIKPEKRFLRKK